MKMKITKPLTGVEKARKRMNNIEITEKGRKILENAINDIQERTEKRIMIKQIEEDGN